MAKHTPGPWRLCHHLMSAENDASCPCGYRGGIWGSDHEHMVCEMGSTAIAGQEGMEPPRYERAVELANARLIAAAPDLLAALKAVADDAVVFARGERAVSPEAFALLEAAIKRAEGN